MPHSPRLHQLLNPMSQRDEFSGAVLVQQGQRSLFREAYGYACISTRGHNRPSTRFRLASISKMFTAVAVLQLIEQGRLAFDTRIVPALGLEGTRISPEVTVYQLLTMTSGIADWFEESGDSERAWAELIRQHPIYLFRTNRDYLPLFVHKEPNFPPGERHQYNGAGYILLGLLIEQLSGQTYFDYVRQNVFARAGMHASDFLALDGVYAEVADGYIPLREDCSGAVCGFRKNIYSTTPEAAADGGASSNLDDLVRFLQALRSGELLGAEMTAAMLTPQVPQFDKPVRGYTWMYGFANIFLLDDDRRIVRWGHTGEEDGLSCRLYYYPDSDLDVVILGNISGCAGALGWEIHDLLTGAT